VPFALLAGATVWLLPETKGVRLMGIENQEREPFRRAEPSARTLG